MMHTSLRTIVTTIDALLTQMSNPPAGTTPAPSLAELQVEWARLVGALALGPEPEVRACPVCGKMVLRAATRCGFCWQTLAPVPHNGT
jgi:hypothetical protein